MTDTYGAGAEFIQLLRHVAVRAGQPAHEPAPTLDFSNISFVSADALIADLVAAGSVDIRRGHAAVHARRAGLERRAELLDHDRVDRDGLPDSGQGAIQAPTFTALEGYIATTIFIQGLLNASGPIHADSMIPALETLPNLSLGLGATAGFSASNHQYPRLGLGHDPRPRRLVQGHVLLDRRYLDGAAGHLPAVRVAAQNATLPVIAAPPASGVIATGSRAPNA